MILLPIFFFLAASDLSCSMWDRHRIMRHFFLWCTGSRVVSQAQEYLYTGLVAPLHVKSLFPTRDITHISCIVRQFLKPWTTREVPDSDS